MKKHTEIGKEFDWARSLTLDLLRSCSDGDLLSEIGSGTGPLWKQFRHIGRVHENYLRALTTRRIAFEVTDGSYARGASKAALLRYFDDIGAKHRTALADAGSDLAIDWFGEAASLSLHLTRLLSHESLHHGQLLLYRRAFGRPFPQSWQAWGE